MIVVPSLDVGGTERQVVLLCQGLLALDPTWADRLSLVVLRSGGELEGELPTGTIVTLDDAKGSLFSRARHLGKLVAKMQPDAVYSFLAPANVVASTALLRRPEKLIWGHRSAQLSTGRSAIRVASAKSLLRLASRRADSAVANSEAAARFLEAFPHLRGSVYIVPNAVDSTRFLPDASMRQRTRKDLGLEDSDVMVLSVGRLVDDKDHPTLLEAFKMIRDKVPRARLFLAGSGDAASVAARTALATSLAIVDSYTYLGGEQDVAALYNAADVVVQSSKNEGYSNVLAESLASETPTVSTDCGNAADVLPDDNLAEVGDARGLADATLRALTSHVHVPAPGVSPRELATSTLSAIFGDLEPAPHTGAEDERVQAETDGSVVTENVDKHVVAGFGYEWSSFSNDELSPTELAAMFEDYARIFPWSSLPEGAIGFDAGCGSGRWAQFFAPRVGTLHCVDASADAIAVARKKLAAFDNVTYHVSDLDSMQLAPASMDFGYSLGVLHHIPDTASATRSCVSKLKPGAPFLVYLYYDLEGASWARRALLSLVTGIRWLVSRLPHRLRRLVTDLVAVFVYWPLARVARLVERTGRDPKFVPLFQYRDRHFYVMRNDALDRFGTRLEKRFSKQDIVELLTGAGLSDIVFSDHPPWWVAVGYRTAV